MLTIRGKYDGFGAQLMSITSGIAWARYHELEYIHTPFQTLQHTDNQPETVEKYEKFVDLGHQYRQLTSLSPRERRRVRRYAYIEAVHRSINPEQYYTPELLTEFRDSYRRHPKPNLEYDTNQFNVAIHIRRGDVTSDSPEDWIRERYITNSQYIRLMSQITNNYASNNLKFWIFSQGDNGDFRDITDKFTDCQLRLNGDPLLTFHYLVTADMLVVSRSSFSIGAGLLSCGEVVGNFIQDWYHRPLMQWSIVGQAA